MIITIVRWSLVLGMMLQVVVVIFGFLAVLRIEEVQKRYFSMLMTYLDRSESITKAINGHATLE